MSERSERAVSAGEPLLEGRRRSTSPTDASRSCSTWTCRFPQGEIVALLGTNGAGKSTLLRIIAGLEQPDIGTVGSVWFKNEDVTTTLAEERMRRGMFLIAGGHSTFPSLDVAANLRIGAYSFRDRRVVEERLEEALDLFPSLRTRIDQRAGTLSGGEQQMMALAQALIIRPDAPHDRRAVARARASGHGRARRHRR